MLCVILFSLFSYSQVTVASYDFETGFQGWTDGGSDVALLNNASWACNGSYSIYTKDDDTSQNRITSPTLDLSSYINIDFSFCLKTYNLENGEGFNLQYTDDGSTWTTVKTFTKGTDFTGNGTGDSTSLSETLSGGTYTFTVNSRFRLSGTCNRNNEYNIIDDILIEGYLASGPEINIQGNGTTITDGDTTPSVTDDTDYGSVNTVSSLAHTFTIQNPGSTTLTLTGASPFVTISGTHAADFSVTSTPNNSIASSGSTTFEITFTPSATGLRTASISIGNNDSDENPYNFDIEGTGVTPTYCASSGNTSFDTGITNVTFESINNSDGSPKDNGYEDFTATDIATVTQGGTEYLDVRVDTDGAWDVYTNVWIDWNQDYDFDDAGESYDLGDANNVSNGLTSNSTLTINIPLGATLGTTRMRVSARYNSYSGSCDTGFDGEVEDYGIIVNSSSGPEINIQGNGNTIIDGDTTPVTSDDTDFGNIITASGTQANTFTIQNTGISNLTLTGSSPYITISGTNAADFSVTTIPSTPISVSGSSTFEITFDPSADGLRTATLSITNDDSDENPYNFNIQGTGYTPEPEINIQGNGTTIADGDTAPSTADDTDFGNVDTGSSATNTFTIQNTGDSTLTLSGASPYVTISGSNAADFSITAIPNNSISASGSTTFEITFTPSATGLRTASISIGNNDNDENPYNFGIQGTGTTPTYCTAVASNDSFEYIGNVTLGTINNNSLQGTTSTGYSDFTAISTNLTQGSANAISITPTWPGTTYSEGYAVWIDFNQDFDFDDIGELVFQAGPDSVTPQTGIINVPIGAITGTTRMRVMMDDYITVTDPCNNPNFGEVEDYTINIIALSPFAEIDIQGNGTSIPDGDTTPTTADDTDFGTTYTGTPVTNTFTIYNFGGTNDLNLTGGSPYIAISGADASDFSVTTIPTSPIAAQSNTTFQITFNPATDGLKTATLTISNDDSDENPYNFNIQGYGTTPGVCGSTVSTYPYEESFETGMGLWVQDINGLEDDFDWSRINGPTPTSNTGPIFAQDGNYYIYTEADGNLNDTSQLISPCFDLTSASNPRFTFFYHMFSNVTGTLGNLNVELSTDNGITYPNVLFTQSDRSHVSRNSSFTPISIDLSSYIGQTVRIRLRGDTGLNIRGDIAIDLITLTDKPTPTEGPGGVTADLGLWLKADDGLSNTNGQNVTSWTDQGLGSDARVQVPAQAPTYYDNVTENVNFNPVIQFENNYTTFRSDFDYSHDNTSGEFLSGDYGFYTQEIFLVLIPDDTPFTSTFGYMDAFCGDSKIQIPEALDLTGVGFGYFGGRLNGEIISYAHGIHDPNIPQYGYAVAEAGTGSSYDNLGIVNTRNNSSNTQQELYYNANNIETAQNDLTAYINTSDTRWWLGRTEAWEASLNARVAEVITYSARKNDANLTQERNRIQSYLGVKYGITLGVNGTSQDYVDSDGTIIWNQSDNSGYNYDIAGIGRDDASELNQKQSRSINNATDGTGRIQGILTMGLTDIYDTNNINKSTNPTTLGDKEFLMWGSNGSDLDLAATTITVNMSSGVAPALTTEVSFTAMQRVWKVVENGGDISSAKIRLQENAIRNLTPPGNFYMFISTTGVFDTNSDYRLMTSDGNGNLETDYDFDGTKYITFGYAPQVIAERSIYFDGSVDYIDIEDKLDLEPTGFTISAWVKRDAADTGEVSILSKRDAAFTRGFDFTMTDSNELRIFWRNGSDQSLTSNTRIPNDVWHHVAAIYDGSTVSLYIDGVLDNTDSKTAPIATDEYFYIGAAGKNTPVQHFMGNIDEVRIWNTALREDELRFVMNQEIEDNSGQVMGKELPTTLTKNDIGAIPWTDLAGYYPMTVYSYTNTEDASGNGNQGALRNLNTVARQTAPLPFESTQNGDWDSNSTWVNGNEQYIPGSKSIVDSNLTVDWNIIKTSHNITLDNSSLPSANADNRKVLAMYIDANELTVTGDTGSNIGNGITVSHYMQLTGKIDLEGESQLIQEEDSDLDVLGNGVLERDQQGTADTYTYNYWSAPVGETDIAKNDYRYTVQDIMYDGTNSINFVNSGYDGTATNPIGIADYWIWKYANQPNDDYSAWQHVRRTGNINAGEGFTMKGPGTGSILTDQNYVYLGKPNNGDISLTINAGNDYLVGNPYASAIDADQFITDNGPELDYDPAVDLTPTISGSLYFWEHWGGGSHYLTDYQGGYATYNFSGAVGAPSYGTNDPDVATGGTPTKLPGRYIPVGQGFFVVGENTGTIKFNNGQRTFQKEGSTSSVFVRDGDAAQNNFNAVDIDYRMKFRIGFNSVNTIHRQLLLTIDSKASLGVDWAYDAKTNDDLIDDMYWMINDEAYVIQASNIAEESSIYPLGVKTNTDGINTITIDDLENVPNDLEIYVHDIELDLYHNLRLSDYEVYLNAGQYEERFEITFDANYNSLGIDDNSISNIDILYSNDIEKIILINPNLIDVKSIELFNILGQSVYTIKDISESGYSEYEVKNLSTGTYIIKLYTGSGSVATKKVLVK
ncbi:hypothetical protein WPG_2664 [Winogradskyella sp. PG-2]|nr:hypothetical protein WPG_2664 [Winogradskyella sp. PG-2]